MKQRSLPAKQHQPQQNARRIIIKIIKKTKIPTTIPAICPADRTVAGSDPTGTTVIAMKAEVF